MNAVMPRLTTFADGITAVDTEYVRPQMDAAHIVVAGGRAAIVDTGPNTRRSADTRGARTAAASRPTPVDFLFLTHVHLDHAGGAGALMRALPRATCVVHPRGAPHMIDPGKLIAGTRAVYGDELYSKLYGEILPIERERLVDHAGRPALRAARPACSSACTRPDTRCITRPSSTTPPTSIFTGDTFGVSYREFDTARGAWIMPTTTPTQFDPGQLKASIVRLMQFRPRKLYLTHYSEVGDCARLANDMVDAIDEFVTHRARRRARRHGAHARRPATAGARIACANTAARMSDDADRRHPRQGLRAQRRRARRLAEARG